MSLLSCEHASRGEGDVDVSSCLDSAATVDLLGKKHCVQARNIVDMESPQVLGTAGQPCHNRHRHKASLVTADIGTRPALSQQT